MINCSVNVHVIQVAGEMSDKLGEKERDYVPRSAPCLRLLPVASFYNLCEVKSQKDD